MFFKKKIEYYLFLLFFLLLCISLLLFKDYGISIDEESTRVHGIVSFNYILKVLNNFFNFEFVIQPNYPDLRDYEFRSYGVIFELFSLILEKSFSINDYQNIFYLRHFLTSFIFIISVIYFAKIIFENFNSIFLSIWSSLILYTSPRIFADSFYNSKDIIFLSFFIIAIYYSFNFLKTKNNKYLFLSSLSLSLLTSVRVIGFYVFLILILFMTLEILENKKNRAEIKSFLKITFLYFILTYLLWPFLWVNPIENFIYSLSTMSNYNWNASVFYLGKFHHSYYLPWHYSIVWIAISNSIGVVILIFFSIAIFFRRILNRFLKITEKNIEFSFWKNSKEYFTYLNIFLVFIPIFLIIINNSTLYSGWRHVYFLFPSLLIISTSGVYYLLQIFSKIKKIKLALVIFCILILFTNIYNLIKFHPFQNVYFNYLSEKIANDKFEIDYWGLSNIQALSKLANDEIKTICNIGLMNLNMSKKMLSQKERNLISIKGQDFEECNYIISNKIFLSDPKYTRKYQIPDNFKKIDSIRRGNIVVNEIYKKN